jgi:hypothetical protein
MDVVGLGILPVVVVGEVMVVAEGSQVIVLVLAPGEFWVLVVLLGQSGRQDLLADDLTEPFLAHSGAHGPTLPFVSTGVGSIVD